MSGRTRFPELKYRMDSPGNWRIVASEDDASIGPSYATKAELLADLDRYATEYGCNHSDEDDWRKGVDLIRSALGDSTLTTLACVPIAEAVLTLRADRETLSARIAELEAALTRIADHESRADRRHRGMVDASEIQDLQRIARAALAATEGK